MRQSRVNKHSGRKEPRYGLKDMYIDRPGGDAGAIIAAVWGNSEAEFAEIVIREVEAEQRRYPGRFVNKIGRRVRSSPSSKP